MCLILNRGAVAAATVRRVTPATHTQYISRLEHSLRLGRYSQFGGSCAWPWDYYTDWFQDQTFFPAPVSAFLTPVPLIGSVVVCLTAHQTLAFLTVARVSAPFASQRIDLVHSPGTIHISLSVKVCE
jgi:hypothetical protein